MDDSAKNMLREIESTFVVWTVVDMRVILRLSSGDEQIYEIIVESDDATLRLQNQKEPKPLSNMRVDELRNLVGDVVSTVTALKDGSLLVRFESGCILNVPSSQMYESWQLLVYGGGTVVCMAGGGLAVWST